MALQCDGSNASMGISTDVEVIEDGRLGITLRHPKRHIDLGGLGSKLGIEKSLGENVGVGDVEHNDSDLESLLSELPNQTPMCIVIQVVGSRGDVQPFVALGLTLRRKYGHRVRIATHAVFRQFIQENELEFFDIGGDPKELMAFMVRNPGLLPGLDSLRSGDVQQQRENMRAILDGCWKSCVLPASVTATATDDSAPFVADAIIANPPSFAHIHCAERLGIPLHLMFTMPFSPTQEFPHPLASVRGSDVSAGLTNKLTFSLIERVTWYGLGDIINRFRYKTLGLSPINLARAPGLVTRLNVPHTYCWSPALLKKPKDWGPKISVSGFFFLPTIESFEPPPDLLNFIESGEPPIYVGFGSIVVDDPQRMTDLILSAVEKAGVRALVSEGWSSLGTNTLKHSQNVFFLGSVPHTWLFDHVSAVVHHGGAGTTAAGLAAGKPTVVVPFFGDQAFWGDLVASSGIGPRPIPYAKQNAEELARQIRQALQQAVKLRAREIQAKIRHEQGCEDGARHFHQMLPRKDLQCMLAPERRAVWQVRGKGVRLSAVAAAILLQNNLIRVKDIALHRSVEYVVKDLPTDPITGGAFAFLGSFSDMLCEACAIPSQLAKSTHNTPTPSPSASCVDVGALPTGRPPPLPYLPVSSTSSIVETDVPRIESPRTPRPRIPMAGVVMTTAGTSIGKVGKAILSTPGRLSMGIARGFQSLPISYGDRTVREPEKVTGLRKGIEVGSKELVFGFYDGITGVLTQPMHGARRNGAAGFTQGLAHGLGGLILKPGAGLFGLPAYSLEGVNQAMHKRLNVSHGGLIVKSRLEQGEREMLELHEEEKSRIVRNWIRIS